VLLILSLGHLVVDIYQGALPAILPFLKEKLDLTYAMTGMILMASNFTSSILQPVFGYVSDKKAMAYLLPLGLVAAGVGFSVLPFSPYFLLILGLVIISGLGVASYHPEGYKTAHFFTGDRPATGMSVFSVGGTSVSLWVPSFHVHHRPVRIPLAAVIVVPSLLCAAVIVAYRRTIMVPVAVHGRRQEGRRRRRPRWSTSRWPWSSSLSSCVPGPR
jgi:FSR family fosmidomycin resistance protein-like MFS transporter